MQAHMHTLGTHTCTWINGRTHSSSLQLTVLVWRVHFHGWHQLRPSGREGPQTVLSCQQGRHVREKLHCRRTLPLLCRKHRTEEGREKKRKKYRKSGEERRTKGGEREKGRKKGGERKEEEGEEKVQRRNEGGIDTVHAAHIVDCGMPSVHSLVIYSTGMLAGFNSLTQGSR